VLSFPGVLAVKANREKFDAAQPGIGGKLREVAGA
jgi:hypothetical protein